MKTIEIIMVIFACTISLIALFVMLTNMRKKEGQLGYFEELAVGADGKTYIKFSSTTFLSFLFCLFLFMGNLIFITEIAEGAAGEGGFNWQFSIVFLIFNVIFSLGVFAPKQLKSLDYNKLIGLLKPDLTKEKPE